MLKKMLALTLALATTVTLLVGCTEPTREPTIAPPKGATTSSESETPVSSEPSSPIANGVGTREDPADFDSMPDILPDTRTYWMLGEFGYEPQILHETSNDKFDFTISVPELPSELAEVAQARGESYIMIVTRAKDSDLFDASVFFYKEELMLQIYTDTDRLADAAISGEKDVVYMISTGNLLLYERIFNTAIIVPPTGDIKDSTMIYEGEVTEADDFTDTSFTPTDQEIAALIAALQ